MGHESLVSPRPLLSCLLLCHSTVIHALCCCGEFLPPFCLTVVSFVPSTPRVGPLFVPPRQYLWWLLSPCSYCRTNTRTTNYKLQTANCKCLPPSLSFLLTQRHDPSCYQPFESLNHHLLSPSTTCQPTSNPVTPNTFPQAPASPILPNPPSKGLHTRPQHWWL